MSSTVWYCCECNFGPHNSDLYDACISCGREHCYRCVEEKVIGSNYAHSHSNAHASHGTSAYPSAVAGHTAGMLSLEATPEAITPVKPMSLGTDLASIRNLSRPKQATSASPFNGPVPVYGHTYMYICCRCNDGPKVFEVQPKCIVCDHQACGTCTHIK
ncbi:hypothetical protein N7462_003899 [Penicillium macrosclerotiorum]|uniref:uncharacterized protein n=1 Tax=Penicillium macrosclerotiorum TaxID=303699 RepID=UPI00254845F0|nr:uncharacterized protein N7462_003899 [Penicillium macrosclerotiorum]KAJ5689507.1 hypothetical protein N7462_003899 [Penicillium macrosclerotiorum]